MQTVKFKSTNNENLFFAELKQEVSLYFLNNNVGQKGNKEMIFKCTFWLLIWAGSWGLVIVFKEIFWLAFGMGMIHMFSHVMIAFNITHDANHFAMFKGKRLNIFFGYLVELLGCNRRLWILAHNEEHHTFVNIYEHDNSVEGQKILRLCPQDKWLKHHKFQWLYAPLIYGITTLNYVTLRDIKMLFRYASKSKVRVTFPLLVEFVFFKAFYYCYIFILPVFLFDVNPILILSYFLVGHFICGIFLAFIFLIGHLTEDTAFPGLINNSIYKNWAVHVVNTTGDYASKNRFMQWFVGGINLHVVHHLFPKICHVHYKNISPIIKDVVIRHGYIYREIPTFWAALKSHFLLLKSLSRP